jgi:hypothetical protein
MTLIKDLLDLPPQVSKGDFVLNLAAGVSQSNAAATLRTYVVTSPGSHTPTRQRFPCGRSRR